MKAALLALGLVAGVAQAAKAPNLLFIMMDDLNVMVGAYGGPAKTPNIDRLAAKSARFDNAYAVVPACNPSRTALFTGQRPETTGQYTNGGNFRSKPGGPDRITLQQMLMRQGYETVSAGKIFHTPAGGQSDPVSWTVQAGITPGGGSAKAYLDASGNAAWLKGRSEFDGLSIAEHMRFSTLWGPNDDPKESTGDFQVARYCADYLGQGHDKPFMLACGLSKPHLPHVAPREFFDLYPLDKVPMPVVREDDLEDVPASARYNHTSGMAAALRADPTEWRRAVQGYLAATSFADAAVGRILDALDKSAYAADTIVVLMGDHGFHLGDKLRWAKFTLWDHGGRTTLLMKLPGAGASVVKPAVSFLDLMPTLMTQLGLPRPASAEGHDLSPLIRQPDMAWPHAAVQSNDDGGLAVRQGDWNYIRHPDGSEELYDLGSDPQEWTNLMFGAKAVAHADVVKRLRTFLPANARRPPPVASAVGH